MDLARIRQAITFFVQQGWTLEQSAGIVANLQSESGLRPDAVGDGGQAYGIAQWHPPRQANFNGLFGKPIQGSSLEEQLHFVHAELQGSEKYAGDLLAACTTASAAAGTVCRFYERPADSDGDSAKRAALAETILRDYAAPQPQVQPYPSSTSPQEPAMPIPVIAAAMPTMLPELFKMVLGIFAPRVAQQVGKISGQPPEVVNPFLTNLFNLIGQQTGVVPPEQPVQTNTQAMAAVVELEKAKATNAALVARIEAASLDYLDKLAPLFDRLAAADKAENEERRAGRLSASSVAIEEHKAGLWDMTRTLVTSLLLMLWGIAWGLLGAIILLAMKEDADKNPAMLTALIGLAGPIWTGAIVATVTAIVAYRFDGSPATSASRALSDATARAQKG